MNFIRKVDLGFLFVSFLLGFQAEATQMKQAKPNIIYFLVDDMGWQETLVSFGKEKTILNERYSTPNMEILASHGVKFTQAYACPLCSPARVSLMTGLNAARHRVTNWTLHKNKSPDNQHKILEIPDWNMNGLSPVPGIEKTVYSKTLPMFLRDAGYATIHVGKAYWGAEGTSGQDPVNLGFDVNIAGHAPGGPGSYYGKYITYVISEASDLAAANPEQTKEMAAELGKYLREENAGRPSFKESGNPCLWPDESP